jgi:hypothetical protein
MRQAFGNLPAKFCRKIFDHLIERGMGVTTIEQFDEVFSQRLVGVY